MTAAISFSDVLPILAFAVSILALSWNIMFSKAKNNAERLDAVELKLKDCEKQKDLLTDENLDLLRRVIKSGNS